MTPSLNPLNRFSRPARLFVVVGLMLLPVVTGLFLSEIGPEPAPPPGSATNGYHRSQEGFYLRNSMWLADAQTLVHLVSYLFQPELPAQTNYVVRG